MCLPRVPLARRSQVSNLGLSRRRSSYKIGSKVEALDGKSECSDEESVEDDGDDDDEEVEGRV